MTVIKANWLTISGDASACDRNGGPGRPSRRHGRPSGSIEIAEIIKAVLETIVLSWTIELTEALKSVAAAKGASWEAVHATVSDQEVL